MSTRSITRIWLPGKMPLATIYRQMDGYPTGMGADLKKILANYKIGNGMKKIPNYANGIDELGAKLIQKLKAENPYGNIYLQSPTAPISSDIEWIYDVEQMGEPIVPTPATIKGFDWNKTIGVKLTVTDAGANKVKFSGDIKKFDPKKAEEA
jgi:hypothetical protein